MAHVNNADLYFPPLDPHFGMYRSFDECVLDIMANTDAKYRTASFIAEYVYTHGWQFDNGPRKRSVTICPDFGDKRAIRLTIE